MRSFGRANQVCVWPLGKRYRSFYEALPVEEQYHLMLAGAVGIQMQSQRPFRLAVMNTHPIQYFAPLYRFINQAPDIDVTALYLSDFSLTGGTDKEFGQDIKWDIDLTSGYAMEFVAGRSQHAFPEGFWTYVCPSLWQILRRDRFDAIWLHGHGFAANVLAMLIARLRGIPIFMRAETHSDVRQSRFKRWLRPLIMRPLYAQCAQMLAIGSKNRNYYRSLGISDERICLVPYTVDNDRFAQRAEAARPERAAVREKYGVTDDAPLILFASKLSKRKRAQDLIAAFAALRAQGAAAHLVIIGSGDYEGELRRQVDALGCYNIMFGGFANQSELPAIFAASDVFVLPSQDENWGLIVNEVAAAGLPVVTTHEVGCTSDIVRDGENGILYETGDVPALTAALARIVGDGDVRRDMGVRSRQIMAGWSYAQCLDGIRDAIARVATR